MELFLLYLNAFLRPLLSLDLSFGGPRATIVELYDMVAMLLFAILCGAFFVNIAVRKQIRLSAVDLAIIAFGVWCVSIYFIYIDKANSRVMIKLIFPLFTYIVAKNVLKSVQEYQKMLGLMIAAFTVPVVVSVVLILMGHGVDYINYWTKNPRYEGAYDGAHALGHNMMFLLMLMAVYVTVCRYGACVQNPVIGWTKKLYLGGMGIAAFYCLLMSQTRTQLLGFIAFFGYFLFVFHRRVFYFGALAVAVIVIVMSSWLANNLFPDFERVEQGQWGTQEIASGRPRIWKYQLTIFADAPIDRQLAGLGIGNKEHLGGTEGIMESHNDYLDLVIETGIVGLFLYLILQGLMLHKLLLLPGREKYVFLAMFGAVVMMNIGSNSYITRSAIAQMFFLVMTYIELQRLPTPQKKKIVPSARDIQDVHQSE